MQVKYYLFGRTTHGRWESISRNHKKTGRNYEHFSNTADDMETHKYSEEKETADFSSLLYFQIAIWSRIDSMQSGGEN